MQTAEQDYLKARKEARTPTDSPEQPESVEAVDVLEDSAPIEEVAEAGAQANEEAKATIEESVTQKDSQDENSDEESDLFYYDIDGEEVSTNQIKEWKSGSMMQADYTRGKQGVADDRRALDSDRETFDIEHSKLSEQLLTLEAMINEDTLTDEAIADMREYEPEQYIKHIERQGKRKDFLKEAKSNATPKSTVNAQEEQATLIRANPQWLNNGKATEAYTKDMDALTNYYADNGFSQSQVDAVNGNALIAQAVIEAARAKSLGKTNAAIDKRVRKAPVSTRPRAKAQTSVHDEIKKVQARFNQTGSDKDFLTLRKLKRQLNN